MNCSRGNRGKEDSMALPGNGTTKRIIAGVVTAILIALVTQVLVNTNRLTTLETQMTSIEKTLDTNKAELNQSIMLNRNENRDEHKTIIEKIDKIAERIK